MKKLKSFSNIKREILNQIKTHDIRDMNLVLTCEHDSDCLELLLKVIHHIKPILQKRNLIPVILTENPAPSDDPEYGAAMILATAAFVLATNQVDVPKEDLFKFRTRLVEQAAAKLADIESKGGKTAILEWLNQELQGLEDLAQKLKKQQKSDRN